MVRRLGGAKFGAHDQSEKRGEAEPRREQLKLEDRGRLAGENQVPAGHPVRRRAPRRHVAPLTPQLRQRGKSTNSRLQLLLG